MAATDITEAEVRQRLTTLTSTDASDAVLGSASMILAADAWAEHLLATNGTDVSSLESYEAALLKAAKIAYVCMRVVTDASLEGFATGSIKAAPVSAKDKKLMYDLLRQEIRDIMNQLDFVEVIPYVSSIGGDDYHPSDEDDTMIDYIESQEDNDEPFRMFP